MAHSRSPTTTSRSTTTPRMTTQAIRMARAWAAGGSSFLLVQPTDHTRSLPAREPLFPPGISGTLSAIDRTDGSQQMTYNDIPLYYYAKDDEPGDAYGQDVGDIWYVVTPGMQFGDEPHEAEEGHEEGEEAVSATPASS